MQVVDEAQDPQTPFLFYGPSYGVHVLPVRYGLLSQSPVLYVLK